MSRSSKVEHLLAGLSSVQLLNKSGLVSLAQYGHQSFSIKSGKLSDHPSSRVIERQSTSWFSRSAGRTNKEEEAQGWEEA
jgi:hypothetical protein